MVSVATSVGQFFQPWKMASPSEFILPDPDKGDQSGLLLPLQSMTGIAGSSFGLTQIYAISLQILEPQRTIFSILFLLQMRPRKGRDFLRIPQQGSCKGGARVQIPCLPVLCSFCDTKLLLCSTPRKPEYEALIGTVSGYQPTGQFPKDSSFPHYI